MGMKVNTLVEVDLILLLGKEGFSWREKIRRLWSYLVGYFYGIIWLL